MNGAEHTLQNAGEVDAVPPLSRSDIRNPRHPAWYAETFEDFAAMLESETPRFPCIYAIHALRCDSMRYSFVGDPADDDTIADLARTLRGYTAICRTLKPYTALIVFFEPDERCYSLAEHSERFWGVLQRLHDGDPVSWPEGSPADPTDPKWEFCFDGVRMFVIGTDPLYRTRRSRYSSVFSLAFQPRYAINELLAQPELLERGRQTIRARVEEMDGIPVHPAVQMMHEAGNMEWPQYVLPEDNESQPESCPFHFKR
jgi:uncharacterized protein